VTTALFFIFENLSFHFFSFNFVIVFLGHFGSFDTIKCVMNTCSYHSSYYVNAMNKH